MVLFTDSLLTTSKLVCRAVGFAKACLPGLKAKLQPFGVTSSKCPNRAQSLAVITSVLPTQPRDMDGSESVQNPGTAPLSCTCTNCIKVQVHRGCPADVLKKPRILTPILFHAHFT